MCVCVCERERDEKQRMRKKGRGGQEDTVAPKGVPLFEVALSSLHPSGVGCN